jgi:hypothetical protein
MYAVFSMLQEELFPCQRHKKHCKLQCFGCSQAPKKQQTSAKKCPKWTSKKHLVILSSFFPTPDPEKHENTTKVKDFGGAAAEARPRVAKASEQLHTYYGQASPDIKGVTPWHLVPPTPL